MVILLFLLPLLLLLVSSLSGATPITAPRAGMQQREIPSLLASLCSHKPLKFLCSSPQAAKTVTVSTPLGPATGVADSATVGRFAVRYATASRWKDSVMATKWQFP